MREQGGGGEGKKIRKRRREREIKCGYVCNMLYILKYTINASYDYY